MNKRHVQWLYDELPGLVGSSILTAETAEQIRKHYGPAPKHEGRRIAIVLFGILGGALIGCGIILLLAHNWEQLSRPMRAAISLAPLIVAQALAGWVLLRHRTSSAWCESVGTFWLLSIGAAIALIAQTYNLGGDFGDFMLTWVLLALPIVYLLRSSAVAVLYWAGVTWWAINARITNGNELWFWPLLALGVPHLWVAVRSHRYSQSVNGLLSVLAVCAAVGTGASLNHGLEQYWIFVYSTLFALLWLAGREWFGEGRGLRASPWQSLGALGMTVMGLLFTFQWPWSESFTKLTYASLETHAPLFWWRVALIVAAGVATLCLWVMAWRRRDFAGITAGFMPVLAAIGIILGEQAKFVMPLLFDAFLLAAGVAIVVTGMRSHQLALTNGGMLVLSALLIARFFDSELDFVIRGLAFVAVGAGFLITNVMLVKRIKVAQ